MQMGFNTIQDGHPLVVYAFLSLIINLIDSFPKIMIRNYLKEIITIINSSLKINLKTVQSNSYLLTLLDNIENKSNLFIPYIQSLFDSLIEMIVKISDKENISNFLSAIVYITLLDSNQAGNNYDKINQMINILFPKCIDESTGEIKGKLIELMSIYHSNVNIQCFNNIKEIIYNTMVNLFNQNDYISDPCLSHVIASVSRLCDGKLRINPQY